MNRWLAALAVAILVGVGATLAVVYAMRQDVAFFRNPLAVKAEPLDLRIKEARMPTLDGYVVCPTTPGGTAPGTGPAIHVTATGTDINVVGADFQAGVIEARRLLGCPVPANPTQQQIMVLRP